MKFKFIIAPGNGGCAADIMNCNWYAWIDAELKSRGHESCCSNWPDPYTCHQSKWIPHCIDTLGADTQTVVIGHSTGALLAMRLLEVHQIFGAILVAAAHTDLGDEGERASGYFDTDWNFEVRSATRPLSLPPAAYASIVQRCLARHSPNSVLCIVHVHHSP